MKLDKEDSLLFMRIIMLKHTRTGVFNEDEFLEDIYKMFIEPQKFKKRELEHPEFCKCENCMEELNEYNKRNNTTYETEFTW